MVLFISGFFARMLLNSAAFFRIRAGMLFNSSFISGFVLFNSAAYFRICAGMLFNSAFISGYVLECCSTVFLFQDLYWNAVQ